MCSHQSGPVCSGILGPRLTGGRPGAMELDAATPVLACPWHGWEFDVRTGRALHDGRHSIRTFPVRIAGDRVLVELAHARTEAPVPRPDLRIGLVTEALIGRPLGTRAGLARRARRRRSPRSKSAPAAMRRHPIASCERLLADAGARPAWQAEIIARGLRVDGVERLGQPAAPGSGARRGA